MIDFFFIPITLPITIFCILNFMENCLETFKKYPPLTENVYLELAKSAMDEINQECFTQANICFIN